MALKSLEMASLGLLDAPGGILSLDLAVEGLLNTSVAVVISGPPATLLISSIPNTNLLTRATVMDDLIVTAQAVVDLTIDIVVVDMQIPIESMTELRIDAVPKTDLTIKAKGDTP